MIKVEVPNPESIYLFVESNLAFSKNPPVDENAPIEKQVSGVIEGLLAGKHRPIEEPLSRTILDGSLFGKEETNICFKQRDENTATVGFETRIFIAEEERNKSSGGYYSAEKFDNFVKHFDKGDYETLAHNSFPSTAIWVNDSEGTRTLTRFGPRSLEERINRWKSVPFYREDLELRRAHQQRVEEEIAEDPSNKLIVMYLFYIRERINANLSREEEEEKLVKFEGRERFFKDLEFYSDVYQRVMNGLYREAGIEADLTISLKPPFEVTTRLVLD